MFNFNMMFDMLAENYIEDYFKEGKSLEEVEKIIHNNAETFKNAVNETEENQIVLARKIYKEWINKEAAENDKKKKAAEAQDRVNRAKKEYEEALGQLKEIDEQNKTKYNFVDAKNSDNFFNILSDFLNSF